MATVIFAEVSGNIYYFVWLDPESEFNAFVNVLKIETGHGAEVSPSRVLDARNNHPFTDSVEEIVVEKLIFAHVVQYFQDSVEPEGSFSFL
jgi:hypothetical protein